MGLTERTDNIFYGGQLLDEVMPFLSEAGLGNKMVWNPDALAHTFRVYKGRDLTQGIHAVVFSEEQGTAQDLIINDDDSTLKNYAYVVGRIISILVLYRQFRIVQEVLSRISATVDVTEIFDAIDGLNEKIESLGK